MRNNEFEILEFALQLALAAEEKIMPYYNNCMVNTKADGSDVTEADRQAEEAIREMIFKHFPEDSILGEEFGATNRSNNRHCWVIDPLDGTTWFNLGVPVFGTLIALLEQDEPIIGVIHFPVTGETIYAAKGSGCWFKTRRSDPVRVRVCPKKNVKDAVISAAGVHGSDILTSSDHSSYNLTGIIQQSGKFRFCGDCLQHALVCRGRVHAAIDTLMKPWDTAAIIPCIEEAGGFVTSLSGQREGIVFEGSLLTSSDIELHREILTILNNGETELNKERLQTI